MCSSRELAGFSDWSFDPPLVLTLRPGDPLLARRTAHGHARAQRATQRLRSACFYAGMAVLALALASPIDR